MRIGKLSFVTMLLICGAAWAEDQSCPIKVLSARAASQIPNIRFDYQNGTDKQIVASKFRYNFIDALGEETYASTGETISTSKVKPNEKKKDAVIYPVRVLESMRPHVCPATVKFADGTMWRDDGSRSCGTGAK